MKAFLSHSSRDKGVVQEVAADLGAANVELDEATFDRGILNTKAIQQALGRSSVFVLFLSQASLDSGMVQLEASLALELVGKGLIEKFVVVCLDEESFKAAPKEWKDYNFVRKVTSVRAISRLIQNTLMIASLRDKAASPFVGRASELQLAKERLATPSKSKVTGLFVSGNAGIGRRTFAKKTFLRRLPGCKRHISRNFG